MSAIGTLRCRSIVLVGLLIAPALLAGCNTVTKTLDFGSDSRLNADKNYPNINLAGPTQPGKVMTPEEQAAAKQALTAKAAANSADAGAAAKSEGAASASELQNLAQTHAKQTLDQINGNCADPTKADATKCPQ